MGGTTAAKKRTDYGPGQFADALGWSEWQVERGVRLGLLPEPDAAGGGRWSAAAVAAVQDRREQLLAEVGWIPDLGATRAADFLAERLGVAVEPDTVAELGRRGVLEVAGEYKGYPLYCGRGLQRFDDVELLERARVSGRLMLRGQAAAFLEVRPADFEHLVRAKWVEPVQWTRSGWQSRSSCPAVPLFRQGDLEVLAAHPAIDWDAVRSTPRGRPSPLAKLSPRRSR